MVGAPGATGANGCIQVTTTARVQMRGRGCTMKSFANHTGIPALNEEGDGAFHMLKGHPWQTVEVWMRARFGEVTESVDRDWSESPCGLCDKRNKSCDTLTVRRPFQMAVFRAFLALEFLSSPKRLFSRHQRIGTSRVRDGNVQEEPAIIEAVGEIRAKSLAIFAFRLLQFAVNTRKAQIGVKEVNNGVMTSSDGKTFELRTTEEVGG